MTSPQEAKEGTMTFLAVVASLKSHVFVMYVCENTTAKKRSDKDKGRPLSTSIQIWRDRWWRKKNKDKCPSASGPGSADIFHGIWKTSKKTKRN